MLVLIACCGPLISKAQVIVVPQAKLENLLRQRDSLHVAVKEISDLSLLVAVQQNRIEQKDSVISDLKMQSSLHGMLENSLHDENRRLSDKYTLANRQVITLNGQLRRQHLKTKFLTVAGIAATVAAFLLGSHH